MVFDLPQIQMWFPSLAQNAPHAGRARLGHLNKNAFVFVRDHCPAAIDDKSDGSAGTRTRNQRLKRALLYRLSYRPSRETFLIQIAAGRKVVGQALRLPIIDLASEALALQF